MSEHVDWDTVFADEASAGLLIAAVCDLQIWRLQQEGKSEEAERLQRVRLKAKQREAGK